MNTKNLLPVNSFQETLHGGYCGPASLKMVLEYWGVNKSEEEVAVACNRDPDLGTNDASLKKAAESYSLKVEIENNASFSLIQSWLNRRVPVIVNWFTRGRSDYGDDEVPDGHYSVVVGLDDIYIYLQDPEIGRLRKLNRDDFMRVWFDFKPVHITSWDDMIIRQIIAVYPKHGFKYEANYGFVPNTTAPDGEEIDAYVLGIQEPLEKFRGKCIAIIHCTNDNDDKLVVIPEDMTDIPDEEIKRLTHFQEQHFESEIIRNPDLSSG